jgi:hypothetical protein
MFFNSKAREMVSLDQVLGTDRAMDVFSVDLLSPDSLRAMRMNGYLDLTRKITAKFKKRVSFLDLRLRRYGFDRMLLATQDEVFLKGADVVNVGYSEYVGEDDLALMREASRHGKMNLVLVEHVAVQTPDVNGRRDPVFYVQ